MGYYTHSVKPVGNFVEKEYGHNFEYSINDDPSNNMESSLGGFKVGELVTFAAFKKYPHKVWIGNTINDQGYRYAKVMKTVAYIVVDEDEYGQDVVEKWYIKNHKEYIV